MGSKGQRAMLMLVLGVCVTAVGCFTPMGNYRSNGGCATCGQFAGNPGSVAGPNGPVHHAHHPGQGPIVQASHQVVSHRGQNGGVVTTTSCGPNGCGTNGCAPNGSSGPPCPRELTMTSHPPYTVAPPDILLIQALRVVPKGPYRMEPFDVLQIGVSDTLPNQPINGNFMISPEGTVNLGFNYGNVRLSGVTAEQAHSVIRNHLLNILKNPIVNVNLVQARPAQAINGEHLVKADGSIHLGMYGSVYVAGMTVGQIKCELERYLSQYLINPQVSVDVFAYNSKKYYVIIDGGGFGQQVLTFPITGNETVLDSISLVQGLAPVSSKRQIRLVRPAPDGIGCAQVLPIDWEAITEGGVTKTNYQVFPGDRIYVGPDRLIRLDNTLSKVFAPIERTLGMVLLGSNTYYSLIGQNGFNGGINR